MKHIFTIAVIAASSLPCIPAADPQDSRIETDADVLQIADRNQFTNYVQNTYGRRLNRYQNNYGYNNYSHRNNWYRQYGNSGQYGYRNHDYYGRNYGRVHDYRNYYRSTPNRGYNGYYSRPGFSIGGGSSRLYFGF